MPNPKRCLSLLWIVFLAAAPLRGGGELHVDREAPNRARFTASFMGETFDGSTSRIDGYVFWTGTDPRTGLPMGSAVYFEVDLNALDTGIGLRNRHMRENHLETDKHPYAFFKGKIARLARQGDTDALVVVEGTLTVHGKERPLAVTGRVAVSEGRYRLTASFPLDIRDFGIRVPSLMGAKVSPRMDLDLDVTLVEVPSSSKEVP